MSWFSIFHEASQAQPSINSSHIDNDLVDDNAVVHPDAAIDHDANNVRVSDNKQTTVDESSSRTSIQLLEKKNRQLHQMDAKLTAITLATLRLSDNSYSLHSNDNESNDSTLENAPMGWKEQYDELFSLLKRGLLGYDPMKKGQSNVSAVLMGPRGQGKSFILEKCLSDLSVLAGRRRQEQGEDYLSHDHVAFRVVRLNGLLYSGDNAVACAREIARQIGVMAGARKRHRSNVVSERKSFRFRSGSVSEKKKQDASNQEQTTDASTPDNNDDIPNKSNCNFTSRRSGFISNLSLMDEALRTARIDNIPILIILEELDTFIAKGKKINKYSSTNDGDDTLASNDRQLLLYHLLDRVADNNFLVSVVGLTTDLSTTSKLEKRVLSRAEGTSKFIYFGRKLGYDDFVNGVLMALNGTFSSMYSSTPVAMIALRKEIEFILRGGDNFKKDELDSYGVVRKVMEHNYNIRQMDMRWGCRILDVALGLLASDIEECKSSLQSLHYNEDMSSDMDINVKLTPSHLAIALESMGARVCDIVQAKRPCFPSSERHMLNCWEALLHGQHRGNDSRIRAALDLSGPQVAILLAARRILARDDTRSTIEDNVNSARKKGANKMTVLSMATPLTYQRMYDEYTTSFVSSGRYTISSDRYSSHLLQRAFRDLIELDLVRLKKNHSDGGPLQFEHCDSLSSGNSTLNLPLYINFEMETEIIGLLKAGALNCSTALREWGLKTS